MSRVGVTRENGNGLDGSEERTEADDDAGQIEPGGQHRGHDEDRDADSGEQPACRRGHEMAIESQSGVNFKPWDSSLGPGTGCCRSSLAES